MKFNKDMLLLYAVTNRSGAGDRTLYEMAESALKGGVTMLQLREKELSDDALLEEALALKSLCHRYNVPLIINDNVDVAIKSGADGVHVGAADAPVGEIRKRAGADFIIGATAKTVEQARAAQQSGADYLGVGAVFPSPTKKNAIRITNEQLNDICSSVVIPAAAIGGIDLHNIYDLKGCGMSGIAVISAVFAAHDIQKAASDLKTALREVISQ